MAVLDYEKAATLLADFFSEAEKKQQEGKAPAVSRKVKEFADLLFASSTQSYREVLLGCDLQVHQRTIAHYAALVTDRRLTTESLPAPARFSDAFFAL